MASSSDRKSIPESTAHQAKQPEQANMPGLEPVKSESAGRQMSAKEIDQYIARIQAAVQQQWKVPASLGNVSDPLVEMRLLPTGHIESITILEGSGSAVLDASLIRAIRAAAPFILPQKQYEFFHVNRMRFHPLK
jgi:TonB family protein